MYIMRTIQLPMNLLSFTVLAKTFVAVLISMWHFIYRFHHYILKIQGWRLLYLCNQGLYTVATSIPFIDLANKHFYLHVLYDFFCSLSPFSKQNTVFLYVLNVFSKVIVADLQVTSFDVFRRMEYTPTFVLDSSSHSLFSGHTDKLQIILLLH